MESEGTLSIYLAVTAMLATLITLLVAGMIALYQIVDKQIPQRSLGDLIRNSIQLLFLCFVAIMLGFATLAAWSLGTEHNILINHDIGLNRILGQPEMVLLLMIGTLASYGCFILILIESRALFDNATYIKKSAENAKNKDFENYLFMQYSSPPFKFNPIFIDFVGGPNEDKKDEKEKEQAITDAKTKYAKDKLDYDNRQKKHQGIKNPFADLVQSAIKNASKGNDEVSELVFPLFSSKLVDYIKNGGLLNYFDEYMKDLTVSVKAAASTTADVGYKLAYIEFLRSVTEALIAKEEFSTATKNAALLHHFTRDDPFEAVRLQALNALVDITDKYNEVTRDVEDERAYLEHVESLALIVARMAENYYHNLSSLTPVAIVEDNHHEVEDFGGVMANYFVPNRKFHERFEGAFPVIFFDAIDLSAEAFAGAIARSDTVTNDVGASKYSYTQTLDTLYYVFYDYAVAGMKNGHYDVVYNCLYRLQRGLKFMNKQELDEAADTIASHIYHIGVMIAASDKEISFGTFRQTKHELITELSKSINENVIDMDKFRQSKSGMDHSLFDYIYKPGADDFVELIDWDRDDVDPDIMAPYFK